MQDQLITQEDVKELASKPVVNKEDSFEFFNPPQAFQSSFTGTSFEDAYAEAARFLNYFFGVATRDSGPIDFEGRAIVDFGSGWGRMLRLLRKRPELSQADLFGLEQHSEALRYSMKSVPRVWFVRTDPLPPCALRSELVDFLYAYSVFSHLNEKPHLAWAKEIHRILKPSGYVCVTVQQRAFVDLCKAYRVGARERKNEWHEKLAGAFLDEADCLGRYDSGELVFDYSTGGAGLSSDLYGDAVVPKAFFEKHWSGFGFRLVDWWEYTADARAQSRAVLQKLP